MSPTAEYLHNKKQVKVVGTGQATTKGFWDRRGYSGCLQLTLLLPCNGVIPLALEGTTVTYQVRLQCCCKPVLPHPAAAECCISFTSPTVQTQGHLSWM